MLCSQSTCWANRIYLTFFPSSSQSVWQVCVTRVAFLQCFVWYRHTSRFSYNRVGIKPSSTIRRPNGFTHTINIHGRLARMEKESRRVKFDQWSRFDQVRLRTSFICEIRQAPLPIMASPDRGEMTFLRAHYKTSSGNGDARKKKSSSPLVSPLFAPPVAMRRSRTSWRRSGTLTKYCQD